MTNSPYEALRIPAFRFFVAARLLVTLAIMVQVVAVGWQIYALTKDPLSLGLIGLAEALPALGISLFAGHVADVVERKFAAAVAILAMLAGMVMLALCSFSIGKPGNSAAVIFIYGTVMMVGLGRGFYAPAIFGLLSDIVPRKLYGNAIAWNTSIWQLSAIFGPCLGGFLYVVFGPAKTYISCALFLLIALFPSYYLNTKVSTKKSLKLVLGKIFKKD